MTTQAYFEDIQIQIAKELETARHSVLLAVAWFTDMHLFQILIEKLTANVKVQLILLDDEINKGKYGLNFLEYTKNGGDIIWVESKYGALMHHKFCVIDSKTIITGSYNWTNRAQQNDENITITRDSYEFALDFIDAFNNLLKKYGSSEIAYFDIDTIVKRLEIIKNTIVINDEDDIKYHISKLKKMITSAYNGQVMEHIQQIFSLIERKVYSGAIKEIDIFLTKQRSLSKWIDPEICGLKLEIKSLEYQLSSLQDEKAELEKTVYEFELKHNQELGELITTLLLLRLNKAKMEFEENPKSQNKKKNYEEAGKDYSTYNKSTEEVKTHWTNELTAEQKIELKSKYRKASKLCHPDVVFSEWSKEAARIFDQLTQAYHSNDLQTVSDLLYKLENNQAFELKHQSINGIETLRIEAARLHEMVQELLKQIHGIKQSNAYKIIADIVDWNQYFKQTKDLLSKQIEELKSVIA